MSEISVAQIELSDAYRKEYVVYTTGEEWTTWDANNTDEFEKKFGIKPHFYNAGDVIYQKNSDEFFYAKIPKQTPDGGIIQYCNGLFGNLTYQLVGLNTPNHLFAAVDEVGTFRIASSFELQFSTTVGEEEGFANWSQAGLNQLKGDGIGRIFLHDTDANDGHICFNRNVGIPLFIDFESTGTGCIGENFEVASTRLGRPNVNSFGWQFINDPNDSVVKDFTDRFARLPISRLLLFGINVLPQIIEKLPPARNQKSTVWENFKKIIEIYDFRKRNIKGWVDDLVLSKTRQ